MIRPLLVVLAAAACAACSDRSAENASEAPVEAVRIVDTPSPDAVPLDSNAAAMDDDVQPDEQVVETNSL